VPDLEGRFRIHGLAPGKYRVEPIPTISGIASPGGIAKLVMSQRVSNRVDHTVQVPAGGEVHVRLDASGKREVTGPSAMVTGTVMINGKPGTGMTLTGWSQGGRLFAEVDASGRFDMGRVEVGSFDLQLRGKAGAEFDFGALNGQLWQQRGKIKENEDLQFDVTINTGSISGVVLQADGSPAASVQVRASGKVKVLLDQPKTISQSRMHAISDQQGRFEFKQLPAGTFELGVEGASGWGRSKGLAVEGGLTLSDVRIQLEKVFTIRGKVDLSVYPEIAKSDYMYIWFREEKNRGGNRGNRVNSTTGEFTVTGLPRGKYTAQISNWGNANEAYRTGHTTQLLMVDRDLTAITIRPTFQPK